LGKENEKEKESDWGKRMRSNTPHESKQEQILYLKRINPNNLFELHLKAKT
jgi:hypothetical protein